MKRVASLLFAGFVFLIESVGHADLSDVADEIQALRARADILEMELTSARDILKDNDSKNPVIVIEKMRLALYEGNCDEAFVLATSNTDILNSNEGAEMAQIASGCAETMASATVVTDEQRGVIVRFQNDLDVVLMPFLVDVALRARNQLFEELDVLLPFPLRIEVVNDQFGLSRMTGLSLSAAQTTGTVAIAKWGRVTMVSPRVMSHGYRWFDTLAHEMTHLALSRGTREAAPLWFQEGVARQEETRWRTPLPWDDIPSPDETAAAGFRKGIGRSFDQFGRSFAMLPTAEEASVAYAEVASFIRYFVDEAGENALAQLIAEMRGAKTHEDVSRAIERVTGSDYAAWDARWRLHLRKFSQAIDPPKDSTVAAKLAKRMRLGDLLMQRQHAPAASMQYSQAFTLVSDQAFVRAALAAALVTMNESSQARALVSDPHEIQNASGRWWSLHTHLIASNETPGDEDGFWNAVGMNPFDESIACQELLSPAVPTDIAFATLCKTARERNR